MHIPDLYADVDLQMLKQRVKALEDKLAKPWVGLTQEERHAYTQSPFTEENYRAIEAKLKEKNT